MASWLYGTAIRTAREALRHERRRRQRERLAARPEVIHASVDDTSAIIDLAVRRLPEPYQSVVLLCDLSGLTRDQAAAALVGFSHRPHAGSLYYLANGANPDHFRYTTEVPENTEVRRELAVLRYQRIVTHYADVDDRQLARQAKGELQRLAPKKHLRVGAVAPPTTGTDLDGKPMTLADFKGKLVLEFWGSWCGPCIRATPGLTSVAKAYGDRGVVVLGVMAETDADDARKKVAELKVPWRNWLDKRVDGQSPIVTAWEVPSFPTTVVIDRTGVVQAINPIGREGLEKALDRLLAAETTKR